MKKILIIGFQLVAFSNLFGQTTTVKLPFYDGFDYPKDKLLTPIGTPAGTFGYGSWIYASKLTYSSPLIVAQPWANSKGLPPCKGNAIRYKAGSEDPIVVFEPQGATSGSIYASFLFRINSWKTCKESEFYQTWIYNGVRDFIFSFIKTEGIWPDYINNCASSVFYKREDKGDGFTIGICESKDAAKVVFSPEVFSLEKDILIVIQYKYNSDEGVSNLWINPTVSSIEPLSTVNTLGENTDKTIKKTTAVLRNLDKIRINRTSDEKTPDITIDEIRVANTWHEVVGKPAPAPMPKGDFFKLKVYSNAVANGKLELTNNTTTLKKVEIIDPAGKQVFSEETLDKTVLVPDLESGTYLLRINDNNKIAEYKVKVK